MAYSCWFSGDVNDARCDVSVRVGLTDVTEYKLRHVVYRA